MDNFILYDDLCKTEHSIIYKGRRKGSINFVAIHCIEKALRPEITNLVRLTYEMNHKNVVKFYEWYETSNHLWLVVELCTAGTLESILDQDQCLPESSIKKFGIDLCEGLNYIHSLGILFCDLIPRKLMIDGEGNLKLSDFGLAKAEGEDLEVVFQETTENTSSQWSQSVTDGKKPKKYVKPFGEVSYMAPEILLGEENTQSSDLWSLGCILYKMYTGSCPFVAEDDDHLRNMIINKELPNPKGNKLSTKPSIEFLSLLKGLLDKDPTKRLNWKQLINHPFWENKLNALVQLKSMFIDGKEQFNEGAENDNEQDDRINHLNFSRISTDRPRASTILEQKPEMNVSFSISSRLPTSPQSTMKTRNPVQCKESDVQSSTNTLVSQNFEKEEDFSDTQLESLNEYRRLFFLPKELNMSQIVDNPKIQKPSSLKHEPKVLPFNNSKFYKSETLTQMPKDEFMKSLELVKSNTNVPSDKSAGAIKLKLHLMNYIGTLCYESSKIADAFIQIELYKDLLAIIKSGHNLEMKMKAARIFAILFNRAKKLDTSKELTEILQNLIDIISANRKDLKFKQALLPALGEILYFISCQETLLGTSVENWTMPSLAYVLLVRNIGDDLITNHLICKIIENIASTTSPNVKKFLNNPVEIVNALWSCYTNSGSNENLRISCLNALCMLSSHSINIFTTLVEKVGVDSILDCLTNNNSHIQLPILTMISMLSNETNSKNIPEKKLIPKLVHIYESTNIPCRSKAYLLTFVLLKQQNDLLLTFSQSKLINSLERDNRKSFNVREENDYLHKIIDMLVGLIVNISSTIIDENLSTLESVYGRKNPSANQIKLLKKTLPNMSILKVLFLCQTFRTRVFDDKFIEKFSRLIKLSKPFNNGELNLDTICGPNSMADYIDSVISILEIIIQHNEIVKANSDKIVKYLLPQLMENIDLSNSDLRVESLKVLSEITNLFFNKQNDLVGQDLRGDLKFIIETQFFDIVDKLLVQHEPVPFFSLSIIESSLNFDITLINILKIRNILPNLIKLLQNYKNKVGSTLLLKLLNVVNLWSSTIDPMDLYDNGIVDILKTIFNDISKSKRFDDRFVVDTLIDLLKIVDNLFKFVSEFVKKALQAKKVSGTNDSLAQQAEKLLHMNKPFVSLNPFLIHLFVNEDNDINELSTKIVWVIMQLFGSECKELLNQENLNLFLSATVSSNSKRQKIVLRIVKRIITADKQNLELFKSMGQNFIEKMKILKNTANSEANVALSSMIDEILKLI